MLATSARLLELLSLLQSRGDWSAAELCERLEVTERTVRRDVSRLRELGYPVDGTPGAGGGYQLGRGAVLPPLLLNEDEAVAVAVGLRGATLSGVAGIEENALRAMAKLEQALPSRLQHRVRTVQAAIVPPATRHSPVDVDVLLAVATAVRDQQQLYADYRSHSGSETRRVLEPHRIVHSGRQWYLVAWDTERSAWRTFRLDRLTPRLPAGRRFVPRDPPAEDLGGYLARGTTTDVYRHRCRVTVHASVDVVAAVIPSSAAVITPIDDSSCGLVAGSNSLDEMALWLGLIGADFTLHEPAELREHLAALGERLVRASATPS